MMIVSTHKVVNHSEILDTSPIRALNLARPKAIVAKGIEMVFHATNESYQVLKGIDLEIQRGDIQLLMGASGSGKTTLLSILAGMLTPTAGSVCLLGEKITNLSRNQLTQFRLENIGFIFQNCNLFPALTAIENIEIVLNAKGIHGRRAQCQGQDLLAQVGLKDRMNYRPCDLSGGQKQRVAIARALAGYPPLIMADEPTAALDSQTGQSIVELLRQLVKVHGFTVLMVTHDSRIVHIADKVAHLEDGTISES